MTMGQSGEFVEVRDHVATRWREMGVFQLPVCRITGNLTGLSLAKVFPSYRFDVTQN
jgi:hypothetical protein